MKCSIRCASPHHLGLSLWPGMVFVLIGINVCIVGITVYFAHSDRSFAIEPNYYQQAIQWNETAAQRQVNAELGWSIAVLTTRDADSHVAINAALTDRHGAPVSQAHVTAIAFPSVRASDRTTLTLMEESEGDYRASLPIDVPGLWEFRFTIRRGDVLFTQMAHVQVSDGTGGAK